MVNVLRKTELVIVNSKNLATSQRYPGSLLRDQDRGSNLLIKRENKLILSEDKAIDLKKGLGGKPSCYVKSGPDCNCSIKAKAVALLLLHVFSFWCYCFVVCLLLGVWLQCLIISAGNKGHKINKYPPPLWQSRSNESIS